MTARNQVSETAASRHVGPVPSGVHAQIDRTCRVAVDGRRAARALTDWTQRLGLSETEFQVLWRLRGEPARGFDQTTLAKQLVYSAAQISATVEKLRSRGWIEQECAAGDRRRNLWRLSQTGRATLIELLQHAVELQCQAAISDESADRGFPREAAA